jgi:hypothetical protein
MEEIAMSASLGWLYRTVASAIQFQISIGGHERISVARSERSRGINFPPLRFSHITTKRFSSSTIMSTTHEPVNDTKIAAQASSSTESVDVQTEGTAEQQEKTLTERTAVRALQRKERWERNHASAEEHSKSVRSISLPQVRFHT